MLEKYKPYLSGGCPGPEMLSAAPHSCSTEAKVNTATEPPPGPGRPRRLTPPSHLLGQLPMEPRARVSGFFGWDSPAAPASLCWACSPACPQALATARGRGASTLSPLAPTSQPPLWPLGGGLAWQRSRARGQGGPIHCLLKTSKSAPGPFP